ARREPRQRQEQAEEQQAEPDNQSAAAAAAAAAACRRRVGGAPHRLAVGLLVLFVPRSYRERVEGVRHAHAHRSAYLPAPPLPYLPAPVSYLPGAAPYLPLRDHSVS